MAYAQPDVTYLEKNFQMLQAEAMTYAGQWIAVPSSSPFYQPLAQGITLSSGLMGQTPLGTPQPDKADHGRRAERGRCLRWPRAIRTQRVRGDEGAVCLDGYAVSAGRRRGPRYVQRTNADLDESDVQLG